MAFLKHHVIMLVSIAFLSMHQVGLEGLFVQVVLGKGTVVKFPEVGRSHHHYERLITWWW
jgi:hypothetical protein